jgi:hypothetical protein
VDTPHSQLNPRCLERLTPGQDVLVNTIDECPIQIKEKSRLHAGLTVLVHEYATEFVDVATDVRRRLL